MKNFNTKIKLVKWHFYLLGFAVLNLGIEVITNYRLNENLSFFIKIILYLTGILLFFKTLRPFRLRTLYFSFYTISAVFTGLFFLFGGFFLAILSSASLCPIYPKQTKYETASIRVYDKFQGFMARCCLYEIAEPKLYIFEKHLGYINLEQPIDAEKDKLILKGNTIIYEHELYNYERDGQTLMLKDTTEVLNLE